MNISKEYIAKNGDLSKNKPKRETELGNWIRNQIAKYNSGRMPKEQYDDLSHKACTICWDDLSEKNCIATGCNHSYCFNCVITGLERERQKCPTRIPRNQRFMNFNCAMCRQSVSMFRTFSDSEETTEKLNIIRNKLYNPVNVR